MIKTLRLIFSAAAIVLLLAGYLASQLAAMQGGYAAYAEKADAAPIRTLALVVLLAAIASCFLKDSEPEAAFKDPQSPAKGDHPESAEELSPGTIT